MEGNGRSRLRREAQADTCYWGAGGRRRKRAEGESPQNKELVNYSILFKKEVLVDLLEQFEKNHR